MPSRPRIPPVSEQPGTRCLSPVHRFVGGGQDRKRRLRIALGAVCNNNCVFCSEVDSEARKRANKVMRGDRVTDLLARNVDVREVYFTSGEPTLHPELALFVRQARDMGYERIGVVTNGRRLAYAGFASQLVRAGLTDICISIHGHTASLHDALTRTPGSFSQTEAGIDAMVALRSRGVTVRTATVLTRINTPLLPELHRWLMERGVDEAAYHAMRLTGQPRETLDAILPSYREIRQSFERLKDGDDGWFTRAVIVDVPPCTVHGSAIVSSVQHDDEEDGAEPPVRRYGAGCERCARRDMCPGVYRAYADRYGWAEFTPVPGASS
jgi:molybdenum cofactor biosynthesis enzyme MoaA